VKVTLVSTPPAELPVDALAVAVATGQRLSGGALELDRALGGVLSEMIASAEFRGRIHEVLPVPTSVKAGPRRVILYGVGAIRDLDGQRLRSAHHELIRAARTYGYKRIGLVRAEPPLAVAQRGLAALDAMPLFGTLCVGKCRVQDSDFVPEDLVQIGGNRGREPDLGDQQYGGAAGLQHRAHARQVDGGFSRARHAVQEHAEELARSDTFAQMGKRRTLRRSELKFRPRRTRLAPGDGEGRGLLRDFH